MNIKQRKNAVAVTSVTMVGVCTDKYPVKHGNCFSVMTDDDEEYRIVNFSHENWCEMFNRDKITLPTTILPIDNKRAIIHDHRIPHSWYDDKWCTTCCPESLLPINQQLEFMRDDEAGRRVVHSNFVSYKGGHPDFRTEQEIEEHNKRMSEWTVVSDEPMSTYKEQ
jgi:hypothetical protein